MGDEGNEDARTYLGRLLSRALVPMSSWEKTGEKKKKKTSRICSSRICARPHMDGLNCYAGGGGGGKSRDQALSLTAGAGTTIEMRDTFVQSRRESLSSFPCLTKEGKGGSPSPSFINRRILTGASAPGGGEKEKIEAFSTAFRWRQSFLFDFGLAFPKAEKSWLVFQRTVNEDPA